MDKSLTPLTDNELTREQAMEVARKTGKDQDPPRQAGAVAGGVATDLRDSAAGALEQAKTMARNVGDQTRAAAASVGAEAQDIARRARAETSTMLEPVYEQGLRASEYLTRNVNEYPLTALLIAGALGYGAAYLIHTNWQGAARSTDHDRRD